MQTKEELFQKYKLIFLDWSDEEVEKYAIKMIEKYSTIKRGDNVIHLDYYDGLITSSEIIDIEKSLNEHNLELSRFDKNGATYASIQDFNLQLAIFLGDPVVQNILLGLGTNALWDTIKKTAFIVWTKIKQRHWDRLAEQSRKENLNFGLKVKLNKNTGFDLKLDGDLSEELVLEALDKIIDLLKSTEKKDTPQNADFYIFDKQTKEWTKVDIMDEIRKKIEKQIEGKEKKNRQH